MYLRIIPKIAVIFILVCNAITARSQTATTFNYTGSQQTYTVPAGVSYLTIDAVGAAGGQSLGLGLSGAVTNSPGGNGGEVSCKLAVTPGEVIYIFVGGKGVDAIVSAPAAGGFNGGGDASWSANGTGGGGGGATDLRVGDNTIGSRVIVAAGGGGGGGEGEGSACTATSNGGAGGGASAGNGLSCGGYSPTFCGGGAFTDYIFGETGGSGGVYPGITSGGSGTFGFGGNSAHDFPGGGGGGGNYGGGGGVMGGGGGGCGFTDPATVSAVVMTTGSASGTSDGKVVLTPIPTTDVKEINAGDAITLSPNPANNFLSIKIDNKKYSLLRITNIIGETLLKQTVDKPVITVDIQQLRSALYYIVLTGEDARVTKQFVKQ